MQISARILLRVPDAAQRFFSGAPQSRDPRTRDGGRDWIRAWSQIERRNASLSYQRPRPMTHCVHPGDDGHCLVPLVSRLCVEPSHRSGRHILVALQGQKRQGGFLCIFRQDTCRDRPKPDALLDDW